MAPEFDSGAAHEACAPLHWDAEEWDFWAWSEDDESLTDGEDLQFLLDGELEDEDDVDNECWYGYDSSGEGEDDVLTEEDPTVESFLRAGSSDEDDGGDSDDGAVSDDGSSRDDGAGDDGRDGGSGDGDVGASPPIKRRRFFGTYWCLHQCTKPIDQL
jgi:hypothetical protein